MKPDRVEELEMLANTGQQGQKSEAIRELCAAIRESKKRRTRRKQKPIIPRLSDVMRYAERLKWPAGLAEEFFDRYEQVGWVYGPHRIPIVDFEATMRSFKRGKDKWQPAAKATSEPTRWPEFLKSKGMETRPHKFAPEYLRLEFSRWLKGK